MQFWALADVALKKFTDVSSGLSPLIQVLDPIVSPTKNPDSTTKRYLISNLSGLI